MGRFAGKKVLVTGASRGIGAAIVDEFVNEGATVAATYNSRPVESDKCKFYHLNVSDAEEVKQDLEGMQNLRVLARNMAWFLKLKEAGEKAGVPMPKQEEIVFTNFIR